MFLDAVAIFGGDPPVTPEASPNQGLLPKWKTLATSGAGLDPKSPPVFDSSDIVLVNPFPAGYKCVDTEAGQSCNYDPGQPAYWAIQPYNVPHANIPYYWQDPNVLYNLGPNKPNTFFFGIKSGSDQGYLYGYQLQPDGSYIPVSTSGLIGGRNSIFDTNAFTRQGNKMMAIMVVAVAVGAYFAYAAAPAAEASTAAGAGTGAGAGGEAVATSIPVSLPAGAAPTALAPIDFAAPAVGAGGAASAVAEVGPEAAGALPTGAGATGSGASAATTAVEVGPEAAGSLPTGAGPTAATGAITPATTAGGSAWDSIIKAAQGTAIDLAKGAVIKQIAGNTQPGKTPAQSNGLTPGTRTQLPDGSIATVNPDGSVTITHPGSVSGETVNASGQVSDQWIAGVPNLVTAIGGAFLLGLVLG